MVTCSRLNIQLFFFFVSAISELRDVFLSRYLTPNTAREDRESSENQPISGKRGKSRLSQNVIGWGL